MPIIYKVVYAEIKHSFSNIKIYLIIVKFVLLNYNFNYQLTRLFSHIV